MRHIYLIVFLVLFLIGCGGKGSSSSTGGGTTTTENKNYGYLYDSAISGVDYYVNGEKKGSTDLEGKFVFDSTSDVIEFSIGKMYLGQINASDVQGDQGFDYQDLKNVILITSVLGLSYNDTSNPKAISAAQFIQSLDSDNDVENGITINDSVKAILESSSVDRLDFSNAIISETQIKSVLNIARPGVTEVSRINAEEHLTRYTDAVSNGETSGVVTPYVIDKQTNYKTTFNEIKTRFTTTKNIRIRSSIGSRLYIGIPDPTKYVDVNFDNNESNIIYSSTSYIIGDKGYVDVDLTFDNDKITYFDYYLKVKKGDNFSNPLKLKVFKDHTPPYVAKPVIDIHVNEEQLLLQNVLAFDESDIEFYKIISSSENPDSINGDDFRINADGVVTFKDPPDFDANYNKTYEVIARTWDTNNMTDIKILVALDNILDNPPTLFEDTNFTQDIYEDINLSGFVYDLSTTLETNLIKAPDNNRTLSPIYFNLLSHTDIFEVNRTTGIVSVIDNNHSFLDYEYYYRNGLSPIINLNFSVENNNSFPSNDINTTNGSLQINILNKIDTTPVINQPANFTLPERSTLIGDLLTTITKDANNSDSNLSMSFSITAGNIGNVFLINQDTGELFLDQAVDYETLEEYNITIRASNIWDTGYPVPLNADFSEVNLTISVTNEIDNPPVIDLFNQILTVPENNDSGIIAILDVNGSTIDENTTVNYKITDFTADGVDVIIGTAPIAINNVGEVSILRSLNELYNENLTQEATLIRISVHAFNTSWEGINLIGNTRSFEFNITNVIDNPPKLNAGLATTATLEENTSIGTSLITISLDGTNYDQNNYTSLEIISGNDEDKFDINQTSREIYLKNSLDWESTEVYTLQYIAKNIYWDGSENNSTPNTLEVTITNIIEYAPNITCPTVINIPENIDSQNLIGYIYSDLNISEKNDTDERAIKLIEITSGNRDTHFTLDFVSDFDLNSSLTEPTGILKISDNDRNDLTIDPSAISYNETNSSLNQFDLNITAYSNKNPNDDSAPYDFNSTCQVQINIENNIIDDVPALIVGINLNDKNLSTFNSISYESAYLENLVFGSSQLELPDYLQKASKGKFTISSAQIEYAPTGVVNGVLVVDFNQSSTIATSTDAFTIQTIQNVLPIVEAQADLDLADRNGDGNVTLDELLLIFVIPGSEIRPGIDQTTNKGIGDTNSYVLDTKTFKFGTEDTDVSYIIVPEQNGTLSRGIVAKSLSSVTLGYLDLGSEKYDLMGDGYKGRLIDDNTSQEGSTPIHPSVFNKQVQGFNYPNLLKRGYYTDLYLYNTHHEDDANSLYLNNSYKIIDIDNPNAYYILENRSVININNPNITFYDNALQSVTGNNNFKGGLVIWEITNIARTIVQIVDYNDITDPDYENDTFAVEIQNEIHIDDGSNDNREIKFNILVK